MIIHSNDSKNGFLIENGVSCNMSAIMDELELYIDRLRQGEYKDFSLKTGPKLMEAEDHEAIFEDDIVANGAATISSEHLILNISIEAKGKTYCKICNEPIEHTIHIEENHVCFSLQDMKSGVFSLGPYIRETIFLNLPKYSECEGLCPERAVIKKYLNNSENPS